VSFSLGSQESVANGNLQESRISSEERIEVRDTTSTGKANANRESREGGHRRCRISPLLTEGALRKNRTESAEKRRRRPHSHRSPSLHRQKEGGLKKKKKKGYRGFCGKINHEGVSPTGENIGGSRMGKFWEVAGLRWDMMGVNGSGGKTGLVSMLEARLIDRSARERGRP